MSMMDKILYLLAAFWIACLFTGRIKSALEVGIALFVIGALIAYHWKVDIWAWAVRPFLWAAHQLN